MRRLLLSALALSGAVIASSVASAADMPTRYKAPPPPAPVWSWTGLYIGAHVGSGWGTTESEINFGGGVFPISQTQTNGFLGGGQIGYNWQYGPVVFGVEADISAAGVTGTSPCLIVLACRTEHDWISTAAGRLGFAHDRALIYLKGGVAWASTTYSASIAGFTTSVDDTRLGTLLGAGIEYAFTPNWSAKLEYNYIDFGDDTFNFPIGGGTVPVNISERMHLVKAGVNYKFGGPIITNY